MAFSGTISQTVFSTRRVIEHATRRCKMSVQTLTPEHIDVARDALYLLLSELPNKGVQLWAIEKTLMPLYEGQREVTLPAGTIDVLNFALRTLQPVTGIDEVDVDANTTEFSSATFVGTVGVLWSGASAPLALERSDDGMTWTLVQTEDVSAVAGEWSWFDLSPVVAFRFFRVRATTGALNFSHIYLGNSPSEIPLFRMNRDQYTSLPNKDFQSNRPLQFWFDRKVSQPVMHMWPVPSIGATTSQLVVWCQRHIMDVGSLTQEIEIPQRWYEAIVSGLAVKLAREFAEVDATIIPDLKGEAKEALDAVSMEERDNSPIMMAPNIAMYTR